MTLSCQIWKPVHMLTSKFWVINLCIGYIWSSNHSTYSKDGIHVKRINFFSFKLWNIWCQTCESLNVNVTTHNSCNPMSLHLGLQSLELRNPHLPKTVHTKAYIMPKVLSTEDKSGVYLLKTVQWILSLNCMWWMTNARHIMIHFVWTGFTLVRPLRNWKKM